MRVGYVFELCFILAGTIELISMIFDTFNEKQLNFKKMWFIFL